MSSSKSLHRSPLLAAASVLLGACVAPFETQSAYEEQAYLCDDPDAFDARVEECRLARSRGEPCGGVVSVRGSLQSTQIVVESEMTSSIVGLRQVDGSIWLDEIEATGPTPYFFLTLQMKSVGGVVGAAPVADDRVLAFDPAAESRADHLADERVDIALRISNGAESVDLTGGAADGTVTVTQRARGELAGRFEGSFGDPEDRAEGCFHVLGLDVRIVR
ncbi:hypothetical protein DB32_001048 [Sandaracinus amylolyticus]|uniref:Lipoprotein n=1 Tax=Sandaracinus amylolyticus TaxID=927083 RepID=A0A0F6SDR4_9BACT|nr:hypothetical protein DB32_001048 [Sandaracinus amylolyticus]